MTDTRQFHTSAILSVVTRIYLVDPKNNPWGGFSHYKNASDMFLDVVEFLTGQDIRADEEGRSYFSERLAVYLPHAIRILKEQCPWLEELYIPHGTLSGSGAVKDRVREEWINKVIEDHGEWHHLQSNPIKPIPQAEIQRLHGIYPGYPGPCMN